MDVTAPTVTNRQCKLTDALLYERYAEIDRADGKHESADRWQEGANFCRRVIELIDATGDDDCIPF